MPEVFLQDNADALGIQAGTREIAIVSLVVDF